MAAGHAFLAIWHDIETGETQAFERWHTREHMPERIGIPGFLAARRYVNWSLPKHGCFTLYDGAHIETFRSPGYLARLNDPTEWSKRMHPVFRNFIRGACVVTAGMGDGVGGACSTYRLTLDASRRDDVMRVCAGALYDIAAIDGVISVRLGSNVADVTSVRTKETELKGPNREDVFDAVVIVEGLGLDELGAARERVLAALRTEGLLDIEAADYRLSQLLSHAR
ncbi:hypothetical protein GXB81_00615 [Paraburkholderia sp. Ac-20336]|uniref:hypothetical protein n=1 Tax=Burkholderiaceae TaxID=119060 RepID=UPI0014220C10|nr:MULTISPECIES: hypothetical protein [Burkholderiaceae]MBN3801565.1 hypothetical protein [Paraburkholderia sp. Ac-20336]MBN3846596.1 hypothetical protein [Paraburkholderia sp. Ac-20342]NIF55681.1 hypothetical protein [Burkholderia sp. Ax-1724]NIF78004.1 hypothetical protein [Paraburkholderia sp. Cy-641]